MESTDSNITALLDAWRHGDGAARNQLMGQIYPLMREMARARIQRSPRDLTLDATDLANEAYTGLVGIAGHNWQNRAHFFAVSARAIRNIVIDHLRARSSEKRGGHLPFISVEELDADAQPGAIDLEVDWLAVHAVLDELEGFDKPSAEVVELKFFSGLTTDEIAEAIGSSRATVVRQWRFARAWMCEKLSDSRIDLA